MLKIYNTLTRQKEEFKPIHPGKVGMYVCGVTIYDHCHIGHGRTFVAFDVVARYLRYAGYDLTYVRNITDVDDKIIKRAAETRVTCDELTERLIGDMHADFDALGMVRPDIEPRATQHIEEIIELVQSLLDKEHAYVADNGDVMFIVESYADYGKLSGRIWSSCKPVPALTWSMPSATRSTSCCGRCRSPASRPGKAPGARAVLAGTSSAPP